MHFLHKMNYSSPQYFMNEKKTLIKFEGADIVNGESTIIFNLNMEVRSGDFVYIVGKVGTGKTSIIKTIIAENNLGTGKAEVCGYDLANLKNKEIPFLRRKMGVIFQDFQLLMDRSVENNLLFVLNATGWKDAAAEQKRITEVLKMVGMESKAHKMPHQLSGGEQQRIAIARALLNDPELIIADEPTGNLDAETAAGIMNLLREINQHKGTAIVMVTHNQQFVEEYKGRVMVCKNETCQEMTEVPEDKPVEELATPCADEVEDPAASAQEEVEENTDEER